MLTKAENERLTRVGPGTPGGELLRRYWQPVAIASELSAEKPKQRVTVLGEELVIFRDQQGNYGCLAEHCAHRGASLYYGFVEDCGLRCATTAGGTLPPTASAWSSRSSRAAAPTRIA